MTKHEEALKKLKPGDRVRVMRQIERHADGWQNSWEPEMTWNIGKVFTIKRAEGPSGVLFEEFSSGPRYPAHGLMLEHSLSGYFQKGDRVRVRERSKSHAYGWGQCWNKHGGADKMEVGVIGTIEEIQCRDNYGVMLDNGCYFPEWTLEHAPAEEAAVTKAPEPELKFKTGAYVKVLRAHKNRTSETMHLVGTVVRIKKYRIDSINLDVAEGIDHFGWGNDAFELVPAPTPAVATPPVTNLARNRDPDREVQTFKVGDTVRVVCKPNYAPSWNATRMDHLVYKQGMVDGHISYDALVNVLIEGESRAWSFPPNSLMLVKDADGNQASSGSSSKPTVQQRGAIAGKSGKDMAKEQRVLRCRSFDGTRLGDEDVYFSALQSWLTYPNYDGWIWSSGQKHKPSSCWYVVEVLPYDDSFALLREVYGIGDVLGGLGDKADAARAAVALAKGDAGVPAAMPDAVSADGKTVIDFKVGDCGKTRGGGNYEVLKIDCMHEYLGINQPIWARAQENIESPFKGYFAPDGTFAVGKSNADLMPPTHNINDLKPGPIVEAPPEEDRRFAIIPIDFDELEVRMISTLDHKDAWLYGTFEPERYDKDAVARGTKIHSQIDAYMRYADEMFNSIPRSTTSQESTMSNIRIETHTFVNGVKVQDLSQDAIVDIITGAERELAKMKSVNTQTRALKAKISKLEGEIARLVELSDERYAKENPGEAAAVSADA